VCIGWNPSEPQGCEDIIKKSRVQRGHSGKHYAKQDEKIGGGRGVPAGSSAEIPVISDGEYDLSAQRECSGDLLRA